MSTGRLEAGRGLGRDRGNQGRRRPLVPGDTPGPLGAFTHVVSVGAYIEPPVELIGAFVHTSNIGLAPREYGEMATASINLVNVGLSMTSTEQNPAFIHTVNVGLAMDEQPTNSFTQVANVTAA
jgi:hypothetical protein